MTPDLHNELAARKAEILRLFKEASLVTRPQPAAIARISRDNKLPLSFAQMRLWLLNQLEPRSVAYNIPIQFRSKGNFNLAAFEQSLSEIVRRHEVLRTYYLSVNGRPVQKIAPTEPFKISVVDLQTLSETERQKEAERLAVVDEIQPFDLSRAPLMRATLLKLAPEEQVLLMNVHHIAFDRWSLGVLVHELSVLYKAFLNGRESPLPELPIQYADFAVWQREWLQGEVLQTQLDYWKEKLGGNLPVLELPTDHPRPAVQTYNGSTVSFVLSPELTERLRALSRREGVTLFVALLAAFQVLLMRYTGQEDILVGTPIANRNRTEIEGLIGFFVNTLVMRSDLSKNPTFQELLGRVQETALGAYAHQDLPFEKLVEELSPERDMSRSPIFQVLFSFLNTPMQPLELPGLEPSRMKGDSGTSKFDLTLYAIERPEGLSCIFEYNTDLFNANRIERMAGHLRVLLESIVRDPSLRLSELPILTAEEWHQLLVEWNDTRRDYPKDVLLHQLFEAQAERRPGALALAGPSLAPTSTSHVSRTYAELNHKANKLACYLQTLGVGSEVLVAVCMARTVEMVVGLLAILKVGGAYVPLDPAYPPERTAFILEETQVRVILTQRSMTSTFANYQSHVLCLDDPNLEADIEKLPGHNRQISITPPDPSNLAYVIFTSGSTGRPKGVAIEHRSIVSFLHWARTVFTPAELAGVLASTSICFDLSVFELFATLSWGGKVILAENVLQLPDLTDANEVTLINTVPSAMTELLRLNEVPPSVQVVNLAGEPLHQSLVDQIYQLPTIHKVYDLYGPSETTTYSTFALRQRDAAATIGRPIANTQVYLLDPYLQPVPCGVLGEIYIGGQGLARGYLHRPEMTAERFVPNPFSRISGTRLYKTGDSARYLPDGNLEYLGRLDHQVKIRGFRIELGEIETVLRSHSGVRDAVVVVREGGGKQLVAYVVLAEESACTSAELRDYLKQKLPDYMVPAAWVSLPALPLTPNGKVDRKALPTPDQQQPDLASRYVAPCTETEKTLAKVWQEVLGVKEVGVHDDFFELGGHSLLGMSLIGEVERVFGMRFPLVSLFQAPTINQFSELVLREQSLSRKRCKLLDPGTIVQQVRSFIVENYLGGLDNGLKDSDSFLDHGIIDPLRLDELVVFLEATYGITVEDDALTDDNLHSINNVSNFVHRRLNGQVSTAAPTVAEHIVGGTRD